MSLSSTSADWLRGRQLIVPLPRCAATGLLYRGEPALVVDADPDMAMNALLWNRDLTRDARTTRRLERDALIGSVMDAWMPEAGWIRGVIRNDRVRLVTVVDHICQLAGNSRHVAIGSDLDLTGTAVDRLRRGETVRLRRHVRVTFAQPNQR